jgi:hypothetical protein
MLQSFIDVFPGYVNEFGLIGCMAFSAIIGSAVTCLGGIVLLVYTYVVEPL